MTGADRVMGGWAHGVAPLTCSASGGTAWHMGPPPPRQGECHPGLQEAWGLGFYGLCDESVFRKELQSKQAASARALRALHFSSRSSLRCLNDIFKVTQKFLFY